MTFDTKARLVMSLLLVCWFILLAIVVPTTMLNKILFLVIGIIYISAIWLLRPRKIDV